MSHYPKAMGSRCLVCEKAIEFCQPVVPVLSPERIELHRGEEITVTDWPAWLHHGFVHLACLVKAARDRDRNDVAADHLFEQLSRSEDGSS